MSANSNAEFPIWALLPKRETGVTSFLSKYPENDGRGVKIAIFDSGVDPGAAGLQVTSHGLPKIIDMYDATGSGDVDTSTIVTVENGEITGLSGRKMKIPSTWKNPTGNYHIGIKNVFELYPRRRDSLRDKVLGLLKEKDWNGSHNKAEAEITRVLQKFDKEHPNTAQLSAELKLEREELETKLEMLKAIEKLPDIGIAYDCVVFHDGTMWRAVIDTSETGDLEKCTVLGPYSETLKYATLSKEDSYNYAINVYEDGNVLQIVGYSSTHGTHVASISAANFPGESHRNGVAPGAQIINICIGDMRLDGMETGTALTRGVIKAIELKCDVINMSYGERSNWAGGRILDRLEEVVHKHGIIFVTSAGNNGPALSTTGTPSGMMKRLSVLSIGGYVSPEMMEADYSMREKLPGGSYTFVSSGPTLTGDIGITITAPGGAIASVPNYTLQNSQLMNGTSMSSPHATGVVALLLSGLKTKNIKYSPYSIERGIKITALKVPTYDVFSMGGGLLQVEKAFDWLLDSENYIERDVFFHYSSSDTQLGVYLRESSQLSKPSIHSVKIEPAFLNENEVESSRKFNFNINFNLACDAPWVHAPAHLCQSYGVRNFAIKVDPTGLPQGVHTTTIRFYDSTNVDKGPIFEYPVTVIKPEKITDTVRNDLVLNNLVMKSAQINRQFIDVPAGATWASVKVTSRDAQQAGTFVIQTIQLAPHYGSHIHEFDKMFSLEALGEFVCGFPVLESRTLEVCIAKWWSSIGTLAIDVVITFRGVKPNQREITIQPSCGVHRVDVTSLLKREEICPSASLKSHVLVLRPNESKIVPLGCRDVIPKDRQIYELQLTYTFNVSKATEVSPNCPTLSKFLYENEYESQLWMIFDSNKRLFLTGDAIFHEGYETKLEKGDYTVKMQIRHEQKSLLEKLTDILFEVGLKLPSPISLDIYYSWPAAMTEGKKAALKKLNVGEVVPLYIAGVPSDKLPKSSCPGHYLQGTITYTKDEIGKKANTFPVKYMVPEAPKKASTPKPTDKVKTPEEEYAEALRDLKVTWIPKLQGQISEDVYKDAITQNADHIQTILARIQYLDSNKERPSDVLKEIIKLSDDILKLIDLKELLAFFAAKNGKKQEPTTYKSQEKQKAAVIEALTKKGAALADLLEQETNATGGTDGSDDSKTDTKPLTLAEVDEVFAELQKWADQYDTKVAQFVEKHAKAHKHYGRALKVLSKQIEDKPSIELEKNCIELYEKLGWNFCIKWATKGLQVKYPPSYVPF